MKYEIVRVNGGWIVTENGKPVTFFGKPMIPVSIDDARRIYDACISGINLHQIY